MKQRFSSLDVKIIAHELNATLVNLRLSNIYDLSTRIFLFKFARPNQKEQLLLDSGFRCHLTSFNRSTASSPSPFVQKLRKCLRTRRVTAVRQVGTDRILEVEFSEGMWRLYLEFYAAGNVVLCDSEGSVVALLRNVDEGAEHEKLRVGSRYDLSMRQNSGGVPELTKERVREGLRRAVEKQQQQGDEDEKEQAQAQAPKKARKKSAKDALRRSLAVCINEYPPVLVDHAMTVQQFDSTVKPEEVLSSEELLDKVLAVLQEAKRVVADITSSAVVKGYILAKDNSNSTSQQETEPSAKKLLYDDFHPFKPAQFENTPNTSFLEIEGFNKTVDEFFSSIEGQKLESRLHEREAAAHKKLQQARVDHERRIGGLQQAQELNIQKAEAILANVERVQEAQAAVNGLIGQGMDWVDIARLIEAEQTRGNPVAGYIKLPLKLYENTITLLLGQAEADQEDEDDSSYIGSSSESSASDSDDELAPSEAPSRARAEEQRLAIDIDLALTPWANASAYYDQKKTAAVKETKTMQASTQALKSAERKIAADLKKGLQQEKEILRPVRKQFWFEKFYYFVSSDGYLVLGGKDAQQNERLYRRYLRKGDVYVHADLHGAASVIIKNNPSTPDAPMPPSTLQQAGSFSVATSAAWDNKAVMSAYWVNADQVSKTAPTGEYLTTGGFIIKGKKNYLPPAQLLLGFAVMWHISEESKANHRRHRVDEPATRDLEESVTELAVDDAQKPTQDEAENGKQDDDDSDEDFPDATIETKHVDSDDEDFPDAKLERKEDSDDDDEDDDKGNVAHSANPLQPASSILPQEEEEDDDEDAASTADETVADAPAKQPPRHLTAKERQQLRSGKLPDSEPSSGSATPLPSSASTTSKSNPKAQQAPRGKRGKAKKAAQKYADQDPEERELAMRLLGSRTGQDAAAAAAEARKQKLEEEAAQKERRRAQHQRTQQDGLAAEAQRKAMLEGQTGEEEDETQDTLEEMGLDSFTGKPLPGDELMAAIPICAPWTALASYKYKVKMQPGPLKKGKAVGGILDSWAKDGKDGKKVDRAAKDTEKMWVREVELLAGWKREEVLGVVPVRGCKVMMAGGAGGDKGGGGKKGGGKGGKGKKK